MTKATFCHSIRLSVCIEKLLVLAQVTTGQPCLASARRRKEALAMFVPERHLRKLRDGLCTFVGLHPNLHVCWLDPFLYFPVLQQQASRRWPRNAARSGPRAAC